MQVGGWMGGWGFELLTPQTEKKSLWQRERRSAAPYAVVHTCRQEQEKLRLVFLDTQVEVGGDVPGHAFDPIG